MLVAQALAGLDRPLGRLPSAFELPGQHHQQRPGGGQGVAVLLGGERSTPARVGGWLRGIAPPWTTHWRGRCGRSPLPPGSGPRASTPRATDSASRSRPVDSSGSTSSAAIASRIGSSGSAISSARSSSRTVVAGARAAASCAASSQPPHRLGVALLGPEHDVTRHPLDRYAGPAEHCAGLAVQTLAHRHGEIVIDGIADEVVAEGETITRFAEQPGIHRRGERRDAAAPGSGQRAAPARPTRTSTPGSRRPAAGSTRPRAAGSAGAEGSGARWAATTRGGPRPARPRTSIAPSSSSARTSSITNSGFPPRPPPARAAEGRPDDRRPRRRDRAASVGLNGPRSTCSAPRARRSAMARSTSTP